MEELSAKIMALSSMTHYTTAVMTARRAGTGFQPFAAGAGFRRRRCWYCDEKRRQTVIDTEKPIAGRALHRIADHLRRIGGCAMSQLPQACRLAGGQDGRCAAAGAGGRSAAGKDGGVSSLVVGGRSIC
ncbi:MAG: hypothetical protein ACLUI3_02150 [Christensenellales bacterium]